MRAGPWLGSACVFATVAAGGCTDDQEAGTRPGAPHGPGAQVVRDCRTHVEGRLPPRSRRDAVVAGPLWLPSARTFRSAEDPNPGARFVDHKTLVVVKAGEEATVVVPAGVRRRASLDYSYGVGERRRSPPVKVSDGVRAVRFVACKPGARPLVRGHPLDLETQFNGGIITEWNRCLPLDVWVGTRPAAASDDLVRRREMPLRRLSPLRAMALAIRREVRRIAGSCPDAGSQKPLK